MTPNTQKWQRRLLVASLALNLAVGGALLGLVLGDGPRGGAPRFDLAAGPLTQALDDDRRAALRATLRAARDDTGRDDAGRDDGGRDNRGPRADMALLLDGLRADTFDSAAFRAAIARHRARIENAQALVLDALVVQITEMDRDERAAFADRIEAQLRRGGGRGAP